MFQIICLAPKNSLHEMDTHFLSWKQKTDKILLWINAFFKTKSIWPSNIYMLATD